MYAETKDIDGYEWVTIRGSRNETIFSKPEWLFLRYPTTWKDGHKRHLPKPLRNRLAQMGVLLIPAEPNEPESIFVPSAGDLMRQGRPVTDDRNPAILFERYKDEARQDVIMTAGTRHSGWKDGTFTAAMNAAGYPLEWFKDEIRSLPESLIEYLKIRRAPISTNIADHPNAGKYQLAFDIKVNRWREEYAERTRSAQTKAINLEIEAAIESELTREEAQANAERRQKVIARLTQEGT